MSRTRRLALTVAVVLGGTIAVGGVAFAADNEGGDVTSSHGNIVEGHMTPGVNSSDSDGVLSDLGNVKL